MCEQLSVSHVSEASPSADEEVVVGRALDSELLDGMRDYFLLKVHRQLVIRVVDLFKILKINSFDSNCLNNRNYREVTYALF